METEKKKENIVRTACRQCHQQCGMLAYLKDGVVVKVEGDPDNPRSNGRLCAKGVSSPRLLYHPDRLNYPLLRDGDRGEGRWKRISWDEALDRIAHKLDEIKRQSGPEAVVFTQGTSRGYFGDLYRFANLFGTPNITAPANICHVNYVGSWLVTCGEFPFPDWRNSRCVVLWGSNYLYALPNRWGHDIINAKFGNNAKLVVIDPRFNAAASKADLWLQPRPGSDGALALAAIHVIVKEGLYDREFVEKWTSGFDRLCEHVRDMTPEWAEAVTWVPADAIRRFARLYATTRPASIATMTGLAQHTNAFQTNRCLNILTAITGNFDVPGGEVVPPGLFDDPILTYEDSEWFRMSDMLPEEAREKRLGKEHRIQDYFFKLADYEAVNDAVLTGKPYPVRALVAFGGNDPLHYANARRVREGLMKVDFSVAVNLFMHERCTLADIVLPAACFLERDDITSFTSDGRIFPRVKAARLYERKQDVEIMIALGKRLGLGEHYPWNSMEELLDWRCRKNFNVTWDELKERRYIEYAFEYKKYEKRGFFSTPSGSGKIDLYSGLLEEMGFPALPVHLEPRESPVSTPDIARDYPLVMTTGHRMPVYFHSELRELELLREIIPEPELEIHPATAERLDIRDGETVIAESPRGGISLKAKVTKGIDPRVVATTHGWAQANANLLTDDGARSPELGSTGMRSFLCRVYPVRESHSNRLKTNGGLRTG
jgi:anaerobic selenocysteine-containing dehydrogenase